MRSVVIDNLPTAQTKLRTMIAAAPILRHRASQRFRLASDIFVFLKAGCAGDKIEEGKGKDSVLN